MLATAGEQCTYADMYEQQAAHRAAVHLPVVRARRRARTTRCSRCTTRRVAEGAQVWPQVTPRPLTMQFTHGQPVQPERELGVRRPDGPGPRRPHRRLPRSRVAGARRRRPRAGPDAAAVGDVRGLRVEPVPRARGPSGGRPGARARLRPARRDLRGRGRRRSRHALPHLHRQRRRREREPSPHPRTRRAGPLGRGRARRSAVRRTAARPTCSAPGCATAASCRSSGRCAS